MEQREARHAGGTFREEPSRERSFPEESDGSAKREASSCLQVDSESVRAEVIAGLSAEPKRLPCKLFYDSVGSRLFEEICELPEYYLTDTELTILEENAAEIAARVGPRAAVVELGSGSCTKVRLLLEALEDPAAYVPVDVSREHLESAAREVADAYPDVEVVTVSADFTSRVRLPALSPRARRRVVFFPGSTLGNFESEQAVALLARVREIAGDDGAAIIGVDLQKDPGVIEAAYNDSQDVTARFNRNILNVVNREFDADFDTDRFRHLAVYDETEGRVEMRLVSVCDQTVRVGPEKFFFSRDEYIITEYSHKYTDAMFARMADEAGLMSRRTWHDSRDLFSVHYLDVVERVERER